VNLSALSAFAVGQRKYDGLKSAGGYGSFAFDFWDDFARAEVGGAGEQDIDCARTGVVGFNELFP
jgi:hypothetical protein